MVPAMPPRNRAHDRDLPGAVHGPAPRPHRWTIAVAVAAAAALLAGCGDDGASEAADCRAAEGGEVTIVAEDIEWDASCLQAPSGAPLTILVDNQDDGIAHNLSLDAPGDPETELETGPVTQELEVALDAGSYEFVCDIHPNMVGTLRMVEAS